MLEAGVDRRPAHDQFLDAYASVSSNRPGQIGRAGAAAESAGQGNKGGHAAPILAAA